MHKRTRKRLALNAEKIRVLVLDRGSILGGDQEAVVVARDTPQSQVGNCPPTVIGEATA